MSSYGFRRTITGRISCRLEEPERSLLAHLTRELIDMVEPEAPQEDQDPLAAMVGIESDVSRPSDPAVARLFPDAYLDDATASDDFRRYTERSLRSSKLANAHTVLDTLDSSGEKLTLAQGPAAAWLGTLNDLRLVLGSRLGVTDEGHQIPEDVSEDDPSVGLHHIYDWLTYLQETLVQAMSGLVSELPDDRG